MPPTPTQSTVAHRRNGQHYQITASSPSSLHPVVPNGAIHHHITPHHTSSSSLSPNLSPSPPNKETLSRVWPRAPPPISVASSNPSDQSMADAQGSSFRNVPAVKQAFLPPKSPFPAPIAPPKSSKHHQRTSSESFIIDEQPSWLDDLLNEPDSPAAARRGAHRRSSSDSFAYLGVANLSLDYPMLEGHRHRSAAWGSGEFDRVNETQHSSYFAETDLLGGSRNRGWVMAAGAAATGYPNNNVHLQAKEKVGHPGLPGAGKESGAVMSNAAEKLDKEEVGQDQKGGSEKKEGSHGKHPLSEMDNKRAKQQFAQRSRVRKLQYIAELERNVQALQAEGLVFTAELEFLNQQNLMLDLENKALKQRLDSLEQEHVIKCLQHEMLEREIARLRAVLFHQQQQQQQQQPSSSHLRRNSRDLDSQFANLSLKHKEANSGRDPVNGPLPI